MKKSKKGFSILLAMFLTGSIMLVGIYLLQMAIPFGKNISGIEQSQFAYYLGLTSAERAAYRVKTKSSDGGLSGNNTLPIEDVSGYDTVNIEESKFIATGSSETFPPEGEGNSNVDNDYNSFSKRDPIVFYSENAYDIDSIRIEIKVPPESTFNSTTGQLVEQNRSIATNGEIFSWAMYGFNNLGGEVSMIGTIPLSSLSNGYIDFNSDLGGKFERKDCTINNLLNGSCGDFDKNKQVTFKVFMIKKLTTNHGQEITNLMYKIDGGGKMISNKYSSIEAEGISRGFKREVNIQATQIPSGISALDFTVLQ